MAKMKRVLVGLPKPPMGKTKPLFYAPLNGTVTPVIGDNPIVQESNVNFVEGYYKGGLQSIGGLKYLIKGLDIAKDFTFAFTITNIGKQEVKNSFSAIVALNLATFSGGEYLSNSLFNLSFQPKGYADSDSNFYFPSTSLPEIKSSGNEHSFKKFNRYKLYAINKPMRITVTNHNGILSIYLNSDLIDSVKLGNLASKYLGSPDLHLVLNGGNYDFKYGISEVLVSQEFIPPIPNMEDISIEDIILPSKNYTSYTGQAEVTGVSYKAILPASFFGDNVYKNGYGRAFKNNRASLISNPNICLYKRANNDTWQTSDSIEVYGFLGEVLSSSPKVFYMSGDREVLVTGSWTGVGTEVATFTLGENSGLTNQEIHIECTCSLPKRNYSILGSNAIETVLNAKYRGNVYLPDNEKSDLKGAKCVVIKLDVINSELKIVPETVTMCLDKIEEPFSLTVFMAEPPVDLEDMRDTGDETLLAKYHPFISTVTFNKLMVQYNGLNKILLDPELDGKDSREAVFHSDGNPMLHQQFREYNTSRFRPNELRYEDNPILAYGLDFGKISDDSNPVKPVLVYVYLMKGYGGELKARLIVRKVNSPSSSVTSSNTTTLGYVNIKTGIFEK